jgi:hypothetical protein
MSEKTLPGIHRLRMALDRFSAHVDSVARWLDERLGRVGSAVVVGVLLTAGAMFLARPSDIPVNHGELYARLSLSRKGSGFRIGSSRP